LSKADANSALTAPALLRRRQAASGGRSLPVCSPIPAYFAPVRVELDYLECVHLGRDGEWRRIPGTFQQQWSV